MKRKQRKVKLHQWLRDRNINGAFLVLRVNDYSTVPAPRGQFYTTAPRLDDANKAIWGTYQAAQNAAFWATNKFGHQYGVFKLVAFVEPAEPIKPPVKITEVK